MSLVRARRHSPPPYVPGPAALARQADSRQGPTLVWPMKTAPSSREAMVAQQRPELAPRLAPLLPVRSGQASPLHGASGWTRMRRLGSSHPREWWAPPSGSPRESRFATDQPVFFRQPAPQSGLPPTGSVCIPRNKRRAPPRSSWRPDCWRPSFWNRSASFLMIVQIPAPLCSVAPLKTPLVGRTPWSAADAPVGLLAARRITIQWATAGPGGPARTRGSAPPGQCRHRFSYRSLPAAAGQEHLCLALCHGP